MNKLFDVVEESSVVYFRIDRCPQPVFVSFKSFCEKESKSLGLDRINYVVGLKRLLEIKEMVEAENCVAKEEVVREVPNGFGRKTE